MAIFLIEEKTIKYHYFVSHVRLDDLIPFCEWFVIPYFCWYPLMVGTGLYLFFRDPEGFKNYMIYIGAGFLLIVLFYAFFPNGQNLRPVYFPRSNFLVDVVKWTYGRDTNTNVLPSLHVVGTMGAMFALLECKSIRNIWFRIFVVLLSISICLSTVYVKQHSILDVFTGVPLGIIYFFAVYKWLPNYRMNRATKRREIHASR
ncbi:MAG: phosphatase PAP2 family protein [Oscillospiraceae bacterium]|nr:phosphatase PAP2 family protein [Oscillospiraceae bacterium]